MIEPKEYKIRENVTDRQLKENGFFSRIDYYCIKHSLYENLINLTVLVDKEDHYMVINVTDNAGNTYAPFYNPDARHDNLVAENVIKNYNKFMDGMVKKGICEYSKARTNNINENTLKIKIKYVSDIDKVQDIEIGDWIDLRASEDVTMKKGDFKLISLGVAMQLPNGYEAHIVPRSSTFKNFGIIQTNHQAVIDNSYCGDNDIWRYPAYALRDTVIHKNDRICQFRIVRNQPQIVFEEVEKLCNKDRNGIGSTGIK